MAESRRVVRDSVSYVGLFELEKLWKQISNWYSANGYKLGESGNTESIKKTHKDIVVKFSAAKKMSDFVTVSHVLKIQVKNLVKKTIEFEGHKKTVDYGNVNVAIEGHIITTYENSYINRPEFFVIRTLIDKFLFKNYNSKPEMLLKTEVSKIQHTIKSHLNLNRYK